MPCHGLDGCYSGDEVNIGYRPCRTLTATAIRTGRGPDFAAVLALRAGQGLGRQTVRNPDHDDMPPDRPARPGTDGRPWIWVYSRGQGNSGWIALDDVEPSVSPPGRPCRGPAGFDFEPGLMPSKHGPHTNCGARAVGPASWRRRRVLKDVYIRWSPDGTAFDYLHEGDVVEIGFEGTRPFVGVTVVDARAPIESTGAWVDARALGRGARRGTAWRLAEPLATSTPRRA